jgi:hypothetical protein
MAAHVWSLICRQPIVDAFSNTLTIVDVLEEIQVGYEVIGAPGQRPLPAPTIDFVIVSTWTRSGPAPEETTFRARFVGPTGKVIGETEQTLVLKDHQRARNLLHARRFPVPESGTYRIEIQEPTKGGRWRTVATLPLDVQIQAPTMIEAPAAH